jgi:hypothetical protein
MEGHDIRAPMAEYVLALMLTPARTHESTFRRVGLAKIPIIDDGLNEKGWKMRQIDII